MDYVKYIRDIVGPKKIIMTASACIIFNEDNHILLQLRGDDNYWGLPGGMMELNELPEETAIREVLEETGYNISIESYLGDYHNFNKYWPSGDLAHVICFVYTGKIRSGNMIIDNKETIDLKWFPKDNLPEIDSIIHNNAIREFYKKL